MPCRVPKRRFSCGAPQHLTKNPKKAFRISQSNCLCEKPTNKALISYPTAKLVICKIHLMKNLPVKGFPRDFAALYDEVAMGRILFG